LVNDLIFQNTIEKIKKDFVEISLKIEEPSTNNKIVVINATQIWTLKLFNIFLVLAKYLQKHNYCVKILIDDGFLEHIDMVNANDDISIDQLKKRSIMCANTFCELDDNIFIPYSRLLSEEKLSISESDKNEIIHENKTNLRYSVFRYFGENKTNSKYELSSINNLIIGDVLAKECYRKWMPIAFITLAHMNKYSFSSFYKYLTNKNITNVSIGLPMCGYKSNGIEIFSKIDTGHVMKKIMKTLIIDSSKKETISKYFEKRFLFTNTEEIKQTKNILKGVKAKGKKIVAVFPNIFQDATWEEYNSSFVSIEEWFINTIKFLKENNFFIIIKAHPNELKWNVAKSSIDYVADLIDENFLIIKNDSSISSYSLFDYLDLVVVYNGTLFMEAMYQDIPVIAGGNSYIIEGLFPNVTKTKEEYFELFQNIPLLHQNQQNKKNTLLKYIYFDFFCREVYVKFLNHELPYPHIDINIVKEALMNQDLALDLFIHLVDKEKNFDFEKYKSLFELQ